MKRVPLNSRVLTDEEARVLVGQVLGACDGWEMREADFACVRLTATGKSAEAWMRAACEYAWDHLMGEPEEYSSEQMFEDCLQTAEEILGLGEPLTIELLEKWARLRDLEDTDPPPGV